MKKQIKLAMAAILLTGTAALADSPSDIEIMITNGKIAAVQQQQVEEVRGQMKQLMDMQNVIGTKDDIQNVKEQSSEELSPSQHLLSDIGQQLDNAQTRLDEMNSKNNFDSISDLKNELDNEIKIDQNALNALLLN